MVDPSQPLPSPSDAWRIAVLGTTGSGKTTFAQKLAHRLGLPCVELDALFWEPNWVESEIDVFRQRVAEAIDGDAWVIDGNYSKARDLIWTSATHLVWLDFPLTLKMWRLFWRTFWRSLARKELWNGNRERFRTAFMSRESLLLFLLRTHWRTRRRFPEAFEQSEYAQATVVRLRSPREARDWMSRVSTEAGAAQR